MPMNVLYHVAGFTPYRVIILPFMYNREKEWRRSNKKEKVFSSGLKHFKLFKLYLNIIGAFQRILFAETPDNPAVKIILAYKCSFGCILAFYQFH